MKRKRLDSSASTSISSKILCLQNGSHVEVQLDDGKWHSGIILQCQSRRYLVQVQQQQHWIDFDLIRLHTTTTIDHKRNAPFEYRPGQFLRTEAKSGNKIVSDHKPDDLSTMTPQIESSLDSRKKRLPKTTNANVEQQKQTPFVWKPSTNTATQNRRLSSISPDEHFLSDDRCRTRTLSNSTTTSSEQSLSKLKKSQQQKKPTVNELPLTTPSNSAKTSTEEPQSDIVIFRPIIRFIDPTATVNGRQQSKKTDSSVKLEVDLENVPQSISRTLPIIVQEEIVSSTSSFQGLSSEDLLVDDELPTSAPPLSSPLFDVDNRLLNPQQIDEYPSTTSNQRKSNEDDFSSQFDPIDSRSSSTTSTDIPYVVHQFESIIPLTTNPTNEILLPIKLETKSACFLETPPPSLPDMHLVQESSIRSESPPQFKSKRKQHRPQRKEISHDLQQSHGKQINGVLDRLLKQKEEEEEETTIINLELVPKLSNERCDPGYLSDEYGEPVPSQDLLTCIELQNLFDRLRTKNFEQENSKSDETICRITNDDRALIDRLISWLNGDIQHYQQLERYRLEHYNDENRRIRLISDILQMIFSICFNGTSRNWLEYIPDEIKTHVRTCLTHVTKRNLNNKKKSKKAKRLANAANLANKRRSVSKPEISRIAAKRNSQSMESISETIKSKKQAKIRQPTIFAVPNQPVVDNISLLNVEQQLFLSPSSPLTPMQSRTIDELLSSTAATILKSDIIEEIPMLPKERDIYEVIHCLCEVEVDNGFMIQCETCLCWSHCECVDVTATCIPAFFKCNICSKAQADRIPEWSLSSLLDEETAALFLITSNNSEKIATFLACSRRMWHLKEQIAELKLRYTPLLRSLQNALRCDDLIELFKSARISSDQLGDKIERRRENRLFFESVARTLDHLVDCVCLSQTTSSSSCLFIDLTTSVEMVNSHRLNDQIDVLITHLCDDEDARQARLVIQYRYDQLLTTVDQQIQTILLEHRNIQIQMESQLGIVSSSIESDQLSYDAHEIALRTAIERLKC